MIKVCDVSWFYEETEKTSKRLFSTFAQGGSLITARTLKQHLNNSKIFPSNQEVQAMIAQAQAAVRAQKLDYSAYRSIRLSPPKSQPYSLDINIYSEYTKYNCAYIHKGFITEDAIETALERDGVPELTQHVIDNMTVLCFNDQYKLIGIKELYSFMKGQIPNQWRQWICDQLHLEVDKSLISGKMIEYGFDRVQVINLVMLLEENGYVSALPEYLDKCLLNVIHYFV